MRRGDTIIEVLLAWAVGLAVAGVIYGPIIAVSQGTGLDGVLRGLTMTPTHLALSYSIGALISLPLILLGIGLALAIGPRAAERPALWAAGVALAGAAIYALGDALVRGDPFSSGMGLLVRPTHPVFIADAMIVGIAVFGGTLIYCLRLPGRLRDEAEPAGLAHKQNAR